MIPVLLALAFAADYDYPLEENKHWGRKIRRAVKHATKPVRKITKHVTKPITKPVRKFIHHSSTSEYAYPVKINAVAVKEETGDYSAEDLNSLVDTIVNEYGVDRSSLANYFNRARFTNVAKTLLNTINFDALKDVRNRVANLGCAVVKVVKNGNSFSVNVRKVGGSAEIWADNVKKTRSSRYGRHKTRCSKSWRPLTADELTGVYNTITQEMNEKVSQFRNI